MTKFKELLKDSKVITILCILALCGMLGLTIWEMFNGNTESTQIDTSSLKSNDIDQYLSMIDGIGCSYTYISYDNDGKPMGVIVICDNLNRDTEMKIKTAINALTGLSLSRICVYQSSNN